VLVQKRDLMRKACTYDQFRDNLLEF